MIVLQSKNSSKRFRSQPEHSVPYP